MCVWQVEGGKGKRITSGNWFSVHHLGPGIKCQGLRTRALTSEPSCTPFVSSLVGSLALNLRFSCLGARPMPTYSSFNQTTICVIVLLNRRLCMPSVFPHT